MGQTISNAAGTWVVVAWDCEAPNAEVKVVARFNSQGWADGFVGQQEVYGDPSLSYKALRATEARALGIE